jgi:hypothetical protein
MGQAPRANRKNPVPIEKPMIRSLFVTYRENHPPKFYEPLKFCMGQGPGPNWKNSQFRHQSSVHFFNRSGKHPPPKYRGPLNFCMGQAPRPNRKNPVPIETSMIRSFCLTDRENHPPNVCGPFECCMKQGPRPNWWAEKGPPRKASPAVVRVRPSSLLPSNCFVECI